MRKNDKKKFLDKTKLYEMLQLRRIGFSYNILSLMFDVDRTSLSYQCDRYQIKPTEVYNFKGIVSKFLPKVKTEMVCGHKVYIPIN